MLREFLKLDAQHQNCMKKGLHLLVSCTILAGAAWSSPAQAIEDQSLPEKPDLQMTILHTNDLHAHDDLFSEHHQSVGGFARIATLIKQLRKKSPNTVVIDAGDIFQGTPLYSLYHGEMEVHALNQMGYDIYTIGNHEFDDGPENLAKQLSAAKFSIISANMDCSNFESLNKLVKPSVVKIIGGEKVGFVGAITPELESVSLTTLPVRLKAHGQNWMDPIRTEVERLQKEGINKIIIVSHSGIDHEKEMAQSIPGVDAIIGGHTHTRLEHPVVVEHPDDGPTVIVQTGCYGRALGKLDLAFDKDGKILLPQIAYKLNEIDSSIPEDPELKAYIDSKVTPVLEMRKEILSNAKDSFEKDWLITPFDSPLGDLITDALFEDAKQQGAQISFENRGGMRARIEKGDVSEETVQEMLPFENFLTIATVNGATLKQALEHSVSGSLGGKFLDEHGLKIAYDRQKPVGQRVLFALAQNKTGEWSPIKDDGKYRIAINSYSFSGGEGYDFSKATDKIESKQKMADVFRTYLKTHKELEAQFPSRIVPVHSAFLTHEKNDKNTQSASESDSLNLSLTNLIPGSRLRLFVSSTLGVSTTVDEFGHRTTLPLETPELIDTVICSSSDFVQKYARKKLPTDARFFCVSVVTPDDEENSKKQVTPAFDFSGSEP